MSDDENDNEGKEAKAPPESGEWLWRQVTRDVKPLSPDPGQQAMPERFPLMRKNEILRQDRRESVQPGQVKETGSGRPGLDRRTEERLRRGQMKVEARLDLHGLSQQQAKDTLENFLSRAYEEGKRCVLVITGKGARAPEAARHWLEPEAPGVLKRKVPVWLAAPPLNSIVLRTAPAKPKHGGNGALYILLRRKKDR